MDTLGKFTDLTLIGEGAFAQVYRGLHRELRIPRALKVFKDGGPETEKGLREAITQAKVSHPGIVAMIDVERDPSGLLYLVMDYAPHGTLRDRLNQGPLPRKTAVKLAAQIARALAAAHAQGIHHLDLKPENLLFFGPETVRIGDFGLARSPEDPGERFQVAGTPNYMAPEQAEGFPGPASDIWALGAILYEMLCGRPCFPGQDPARILASVRAGAGPLGERLARAGAPVSGPLLELLREMLDLKPAARPKAGVVAFRLKTDLPEEKPAAKPFQTVITASTCAKCSTPVPLGATLCPDCQHRAAAAAGHDQASEMVTDPDVPAILKQPSRRKSRLTAVLAGGLVVAGLAAALAWFGLGGGLAPQTATPKAGGPEAAQAKAGPLPPPATAPAAIPAAPQPAPGQEAHRTEPEPADDGPVRPYNGPMEPEVGGAEPPRRVEAPAPQPSPAAAQPGPAVTASPIIKRLKLARPRPAETLPAPQATPAPAPVPAPAQPPTAAQPAQPSRDRLWKAMASEKDNRTTEKLLKDQAAANPAQLGSYRNLALLHLERGEYTLAIAQLKRILAAKPNDREAKNLLDLIKVMRSKEGG